jgi:exodeoxyribonuclease V alpha subunit
VNLAALSPLPAEFMRVVGRIVPRAGDVARIAAALAAEATAAGHVCIDLESIAGTTILDGAVALPDLPALLGGLESDPLVAKPGGFAPLVLDGHRLYLHRYWHYETSLAAALVARAASFDVRADDLALQRALDRFFPAAGGEPDMQKVAAAVAALKRIAVLCGGPGTGKTTTVARVLAVLTALAGAERLAIGLAAPTGKAAARLQSALAAHPETASLAGQAVTLHRLLGLGAGRAPRYDAAKPLPLDVLVVDEASMIDLALAAKLVDALPAHARLILLGDPEQLASVEAGAVLASIAGTATAYSPDLAARLTRLTGQAVPVGAPVSALSDAIVRLGRSYRFAASGAIGRLAQAVREGNAEGALATLDAGGDTAWLAPDTEALGNAAFAGYAGYFAAIDGGAEPARCFAELERFRVLAAVRDGPFGVHALNRAVERRRAARDASVAHQRWYPGRPVMVARNDYAMRLANGDVGIVVRDGSMSGGVAVAFEAPEGGIRRFSPARMPECETVYALTVHKSQGSEFDAVLIVLPRTGTAVLSRELIYTGVTRARRRVTMLAQPDVLKAAIGMRVRRDSALSERLRQPRSGASLAL